MDDDYHVVNRPGRGNESGVGFRSAEAMSEVERTTHAVAPTRDQEATPPTGVPPEGERHAMALLIDEVSNRLQVILGYAQILHELDDEERADAIRGIEHESEQLRGTLRSLTG